MPDEFDVPQFYETTLRMRPRGEAEDLSREFVFLCAPVAAIHKDNLGLLDHPPGALEALGFTEHRELRVAQLPDAILTLLVADGQEDPSSFLNGPLDPRWLEEAREIHQDAALFAEYLAFAEVVPFEQSKLSVSALATLARKSYGIPDKAGTYIGLGATAAAIVPHVAVVYLGVAAAGILGLVVVDSIGVIVGAVSVPGTGTSNAISNLRRKIKQLIHHPPAGQSAESTPTAETAPASNVELLSADEQLARLMHDRAVKKRKAMRTHRPKNYRGPDPMPLSQS